MSELVLAIALFLATHAVPALPRLRAGLIARLGWRGYLVAYSLLSLGVLAWVAVAYRRAPFVPLWEWRPDLAWAPLLIMPLACILAVGGLLRANPLSISFRRPSPEGGPDAVAARTAYPFLALTRHPLPWAFALWALAHMVPNGDVASLLLFGLLAGLSVAGAFGLDAKHRRGLGADTWRRLAAGTSLWPLAGLADGGAVGGGAAAGGLGRDLAVAVPLGLLLYAGLLHLHGPVIGVPPWPPL